jgi:hypothetical protein
LTLQKVEVQKYIIIWKDQVKVKKEEDCLLASKRKNCSFCLFENPGEASDITYDLSDLRIETSKYSFFPLNSWKVLS